MHLEKKWVRVKVGYAQPPAPKAVPSSVVQKESSAGGGGKRKVEKGKKLGDKDTGSTEKGKTGPGWR